MKRFILLVLFLGASVLIFSQVQVQSSFGLQEIGLNTLY